MIYNPHITGLIKYIDLNALDYNISENINLIVDKCSGDRKNLNNEINKILNFCLEKKKINRSEILKLINLYQDENYFELPKPILKRGI